MYTDLKLKFHLKVTYGLNEYRVEFLIRLKKVQVVLGTQN
jgi:hypothetical protein